MQRFLLGHSIGKNASDLVKECLDQIGDVPDDANFGFAYATDAVADELHRIINLLKLQTGIDHWTGTIGTGICVTAHEYYDQPALALMVATFPEASFKMIPTQQSDVQGFISGARAWYEKNFSHFGIVHGDPTNPITPALFEAVAQSVPDGFFVGGLTSSNGHNLQIADEVTSGGISGVVFSDALAVAVGHTQGCTPLGARHEITACERNLLIELDGRPALDVLREDIGEVLAKDLRRIGGYIFAGLPIQGSDTGDYMVRNLVGIDTENKLVAIGDHPTEGDEFLFCQRDGNSAREDMQRMLDSIGRRIDGQPRGAVYYTCLGRGRYQFGEDSEELKMISARLGDIPLVGFFANGEFFHNRLYGYTGVLTVFL
ncbi:MAG: FIST signal transduction protein [Gammaproteobacteria bacterium]